VGGKPKQQYRHLPAFILLVLAEGPVHGGAIHTMLTNSMPKFSADTGAVYRTLQKLEKDGEVASAWDTTKSGPAIKIYEITPAGRQKLVFWKQDIEMRIATLNCFLVTYAKLPESK